MTSQQKNLAQILWDNGQVFGIEGIVFVDKIFEIQYIEDNHKRLYQSQFIRETTIEAELKTYPSASIKVLEDGKIETFPDPNNILEIGIYIDPYPNTPLPYKNGKFFWGSGTMGEDGFLVFIDNSDNFVWSMIWGFNPIIWGEIVGDYLNVKTDNGHSARINLMNLTDIQVIYSDWYIR